MNTHGVKCDFGRWKGTFYTRIPVSYLKWMVQSNHSKSGIAKAELERRGTTTPDLDISGHAIDRASISCRTIWHQTKKEGEGLNSWLIRMAGEALEKETDDKGRHVHSGMLFAFEKDGAWPVLVTVMREKART